MRAVPGQLRRALLLAAVVTAFAGSATWAQDAASSSPATQPIYPALQQLNADCVALFKRMQGSVLRVQMPSANRMNDAIANDNRFSKYKLNSDVNRAIQQRAARSNNYEQSPPQPNQPAQVGQTADGSGADRGTPGVNKTPQTGPALTPEPSQSDNTAPIESNRQQGYTIIVPAQQAVEQQQQLWVNNNALQNAKQPFLSNNIGLLLSDRGHVLVPVYLEREAVGDQPIRLACGDGEPVLAKYIGADQQTQLTVLQLADPQHAAAKKKAEAGADGKADAPNCIGQPLQLSEQTLTEGNVVLMLSPSDGSARLSVWNGDAKDFGVVVTIDGKVAGIARHGQFLSGSACKLIADQIVRHGAVRRATLGVIITQVEPADPARQAAALGDKPAVRIDQVMKDSVAEAGGLRKGDLILSLANEPVHDIPSLAAAIAARQGPTELRILRDGEIISVRVDLVQK